MKAIVVDDEARSIDNLCKLLAQYCPIVQVQATANNIADAYEKIIIHQPDIVFLDIDMPPDTGFDLLKKFDEIPFEVIFVTAYDYYAIDAIKFSALYYIMKPVRVDELVNAVEKAQKTYLKNNKTSSTYLKLLNPKGETLKRIIINTLQETKLLELYDINYIEADNAYSMIYTLENKKIICSQRSIKDYEEMLKDKGFFRCHKSYLVNLSHISGLNKREGGELILKNQVQIPVARRRKEELLKLL